MVSSSFLRQLLSFFVYKSELTILLANKKRKITLKEFIKPVLNRGWLKSHYTEKQSNISVTLPVNGLIFLSIKKDVFTRSISIKTKLKRTYFLLSLLSSTKKSRHFRLLKIYCPKRIHSWWKTSENIFCSLVSDHLALITFKEFLVLLSFHQDREFPFHGSQFANNAVLSSF